MDMQSSTIWQLADQSDTPLCERCGQRGDWLQLSGYRTAHFHGYIYLCHGCHMDLIPDPEIYFPQLLNPDFTFFYGCASGSSRKALRKMEEENVMVSHATRNNGHLGTEHRHFTDCGGSPDSFLNGRFSQTGDYVSSDTAYLNYIEDQNSDLWSLRDYPCEPHVLEKHGRSVREHQLMGLDRARSLLDLAQDRHIQGQPVSVVQGWTIEDYLIHIDLLAEHGCLTDYVGIGSICREHDLERVHSIILTVRDALPARHKLHAFGVKLPVLERQGVLDALDSADSCAYDYGLMMESIYGDETYSWKPVVHAYLDFKRSIGELLKKYKDTEQREIDSYLSASST